MNVFSLFKNRHIKTVVLIEIGSASISGAYALIDEKNHPIIYYSNHAPIHLRHNTSLIDKVTDALQKITKDLLTNGAPTTAHRSGRSIYIDSIIVSIAAPWQETQIRKEQKNRHKPFRFTKLTMDEMVTHISKRVADGRVITNNLVISTSLNGYAVQHPFGISTKEAEVVVLESYIDKEMVTRVRQIIINTFHNNNIEITAFAPVIYAVLRIMYPNEQNMLILDISGEATDIVLIKDGILIDVVHTQRGLNMLRKSAYDAGIHAAEPSESFHTMEHTMLIDSKRNTKFTASIQQARALWLQDVIQALQTLNIKYVLPKNIFLLADDEAISFIKRQLDKEPSFQTLWLSTEPIPIITLSTRQFFTLVQYRGGAQNDTFISILALYATTH